MTETGYPTQPQLTQTQASLFARPGMAMPPPAVAAEGVPGAPPTCKVTFEVKGHPLQSEAFFHVVSRADDHLVLAFDSRAVGYPRVMPKDANVEIAVLIDNMDRIFVTTLVCQLSFLNYELCILKILDERPLS